MEKRVYGIVDEETGLYLRAADTYVPGDRYTEDVFDALWCESRGAAEAMKLAGERVQPELMGIE